MEDNELFAILDKIADKTQKDEKGLSIDSEQEKIRYQKLRNDNLEKANSHRGILVIWMMSLVSVWLVLTSGIVIAQLCIDALSDAVLCALLTSTTVNVLGLAVIVLQGLFHNKKVRK